MGERNQEEFEALVRPLMKWINDNYHPHTHIIITLDTAEISCGEQVFYTEEYIND